MKLAQASELHMLYGHIWEYLSQTNDNAECVPVEDRYKFVDDLSTVEIINL